MGKQTKQGTEWETEIVRKANAHARGAERIAKQGVKHEPDVRVWGSKYLPVVFWKNWVKRSGKRRRSVRMVALLEEDFWKLVDKDDTGEYGFLVQAKSTQTLSVRATLEGLVAAIATIRERNSR